MLQVRHTVGLGPRLVVKACFVEARSDVERRQIANRLWWTGTFVQGIHRCEVDGPDPIAPTAPYGCNELR